jgi:hypothetical protein
VLQQELVEDHREHRLVGHHPVGEVPLENRRELSIKPGRHGEVRQQRLEVSGSLHQIHATPPHRPLMPASDPIQARRLELLERAIGFEATPFSLATAGCQYWYSFHNGT